MRAGRPPPPLAHLLGPLGSHAAPMWGRWELLPPPCKVSVCAPHYSGNTGPPRRQESKGTVSKRTVPKRTVRRASSHYLVPLPCRRVCFQRSPRFPTPATEGCRVALQSYIPSGLALYHSFCFPLQLLILLPDVYSSSPCSSMVELPIPTVRFEGARTSRV